MSDPYRTPAERPVENWCHGKDCGECTCDACEANKKLASRNQFFGFMNTVLGKYRATR